MSTGIEWTEETWNPTVGCHKVSPGCKNCYAEVMHGRLTAMGQAKYAEPFRTVRLWEEHLYLPLRWRSPRTIFVNSMSDLFHADLRDGEIARVWDVMGRAPWHTFQVLTKRPDRMRAWVKRWHDLEGECYAPQLVRGPEETRAAHPSGRGQLFADLIEAMGTPPPGAAYPTFDWMEGQRWWDAANVAHVWLGTSVESSDYLHRVAELQAAPAAVRFLSLEPLLGPIRDLPLDGISWVIVGGESGRDARPVHPKWVRDIRDQCLAAGVRFFFKQWGEFGPGSVRTSTGEPVFREFDTFQRWVDKAQTWLRPGDACLDAEGRRCLIGRDMMRARDEGTFPVTVVTKLGKKKAGRILDGRTWDEVPA